MIEKSPFSSLAELRRLNSKVDRDIRKYPGLDKKLCLMFGWEWKEVKIWTYELCKLEALKYTTRTEWFKNSIGSYNKSKKKGWLDECIKHMIEVRVIRGYWSIERCKEEALKYQTKRKWQVNSSSSYQAARKNNWIDQCSEHMKELQKPVGYWTLEKCKEDALKYETRAEWANSAGVIARRNGWLEECTQHMIEIRTPKGYWTLERCKEEALKYKTKAEWAKESNSSLISAINKGWFDECSKHFIETRMPKGYWTLEKCKKEALKYQTRTEWEKNSKKSYRFASKNSWIDECSKHMTRKLRTINGITKIFWSFEKCKEEALKYQTKTEWAKKSDISYRVAKKNNWFNECSAHMIGANVPMEYWTLEKCKEDALKYQTKTKWANNSSGSYNAAKKNDWFNECSAHMVEIRLPMGYWTLERCKEEALKYQTRSKWQRNHNKTYDTASKKKWLEECCSHMIMVYKPEGYWNFDTCFEDAKKFNSIKEWRSNSLKIYEICLKIGELKKVYEALGWKKIIRLK